MILGSITWECSCAPGNGDAADLEAFQWALDPLRLYLWLIARPQNVYLYIPVSLEIQLLRFMPAWRSHRALSL